MKKTCIAGVAATIALCMLPYVGNAQGTFAVGKNSIAAICQENILWNAEYVNSRGETIPIHVTVQTPKVNQLPVLRVIPYPMQKDFQMLFQSPTGQTNANWSSYIAAEYVSAFHNWEHGLEAGEKPTSLLIEYEYIPTADLEWTKIYAENSPLSFGDAFDTMESVLKRICETYGSGRYYPMEIASVEIKSIPKNKNGEPVRQRGAYVINCYQTIDGIPILMNAAECFSNSSGNDSAVPRGYFWSITDTDSYYFIMALLERESVLYSDIPIIGFESIRPALEEMILASKIRNIYFIRLGFVVFMENRSSRASYVLAPSWVVECEYYDRAKQERAAGENDLEFYKQTNYRKLVFNAQTGQLVDPNREDKQRSVAPNILTWE